MDRASRTPSRTTTQRIARAFAPRLGLAALSLLAALPTAATSAYAAAITGTVFEDVTYGGGAGRSRAASSGVARSNARVELYSAAGAYLAATTTNGSGAYSFTVGSAGTYVVRLVNSTVSSSRSGYVAGTHLSVQTFRTDASSGIAVDVTDHVGGQNPSVADAVSGLVGVALNPSTGVFTAGISGTAQSLTSVAVGATDVAGVDFGFCFDVIVNRNGTGQGSLTQFLVNANGLSNSGLAQAGRPPGKDNAIFMLADGTARPGTHTGYANLFPGGIATIAPSNAPPAITDPVVLDASTHPRWSGAPVIELSGANAGAADGFTITASNCVVRGFVIDAWNGNAIVLGGNGGTVTGNYLGTTPAGTAVSLNSESGVYIMGASNTIGGLAAADRNIVSGSRKAGITITGVSATGNQVLGDYIGVDVTGAFAIPNLQHGVAVLAGASSNTIGGTNAAASNVISGNNVGGMNGVYVNLGSGNVIQGNRIGTNAAGNAAIPNGNSGVFLKATSGATVGGVTAGAGNLIAYNGAAGVTITGATAVGSTVLGNSIFGDTGLGIDLADDGVTPNDGARNLNAPNDDMDYPVFTSAVLTGSTLTVAGYVGSAPGQAAFAGSRVEIFRADNDATGFGEGTQLVGTLTTDLNGNFSGTFPGTALTTTDKITATATDPAGQTSEFGPNVFLVDAIAGTVFEDPNYGGGAGRSRVAASGVPVAGARVEVFNGSGAFLGADTTDAQGAYSFKALPSGTYTVRVVSGSVASTRAGFVPGLIPVQTFRTDASGGGAVAVTDHVGGEVPGRADAGNGSTTLSALSTQTTTAQSITSVSLGASIVTGVDFGFCFDVVVNKADAGQGSFRQFLLNANALANAGLAQAGRNAAIDNAIFMFADGTARPGLNTGYSSMFSSGAVAIALASALPTITEPVVVDAQTLPQWTALPVLELNGSNVATGAGLTISCGGSTLRGLAVNRFTGAGVFLVSGSGNRIAGCHVGTGPTGTEGRGNGGPGILIQDSPDNTVGGTTAAERNCISDGASDGIRITGAGSIGNVVSGNYVGTTSAGTTALANTTNGVWILGGARNNTIGGTAPGAGNVISGNKDDGVEIQDATTSGNVVLGNLIGTDVTGTTAIKNTDVGVLVDGAPNNVIGGHVPAARNVISGNGTDGVRIAGASAMGNLVEGNLVGVTAAGTAALENVANGVRVTNDAEGTAIGDPSNNTIGGTAAGATNVIANNGAAGVAVVRGTGIAIVANAIYANATLGIDLGADGVTINDGAKNGGLPNLSMDYPVITSQELVGSSLSVTGYVGSVAGQSAFANTRVDFYRSDQDASGYGEGKTFLGSLTTGANGNFSGSIDVTGIGLVSGNRITGAAVDASSNTSEFGPSALLLASISGTVFEDVTYGGGAGRDRPTAAGVGRSGARVELLDGSGVYVKAVTTDAAGRYTFTGLVNDNYTVRVVNNTVSSSRIGFVSGTHLAVQTYRTDATSGTPLPVTDHVGGQVPAAADAPNAKGGAILNRTTSRFTAGITGIAQSPTTVALTGVDVAGVDFGYSFDVVVNTNNSGQGSLRQFLINANALANAGLAQAGRPAGMDNAVFMIADGVAHPGLTASYPTLFVSGVATISPASSLPTITAPVVIDARTQPGFAGAPFVELNGTSAGGSASGLSVTGGGSTLGGLVINRFGANGITLSGVGNNVVVGNHIGVNAAGTSASANTQDGILVSGPDNLIGGITAADRNIISGNGWVGIEVAGPGALRNRIQGNYVGLNRAGTLPIPNLNDGIDITGGASNTTVGGTSPGAGNVISGNNTATMDGVWINLGSGNLVQGNLIGTNAAGTAGMPNARSGVYVLNSSGNTIGGTDPAAANVIAYNDSVGVRVLGNSPRNSILANGIYGNRYLGIDLGSNGVTPNDGAEVASQPNQGMDMPVLSGAQIAGSTLTVSGYVGAGGSASTFAGSRVEIFMDDGDPSGYGEGRVFLDAATTGANGWFSTAIPASGVTVGDRISATATDPAGNTSEFSAFVAVSSSPTSDLTLALAVDRNPVHELDVITYTATVTNFGPSTATGITLTDVLPLTLDFLTATPSQGTWSPTSGVWSAGTLAPGATATLSLQARVAEGSSGLTVVNRASVSGTLPDPNPADDSASVAVYVQSWGARLKTGTFVGTGVAGRAITGVGFKPDFVLIKGYTNKAGVVTTSSMVAAGAKELGPVTALQTGMITSLNSDGFTLGSSQSVNRSGTTYSYVAAEASGGALTIGQYTGNGVNPRPVTGVGFEPEYVMVLGEGPTQATQRFVSEASSKGSVFGPYQENNSWIKTFDADGFSVGNDSDVNGSGSVYYYVAWNALPNTMSVGTYTGSGVDNLPVTGAGFTPEWVLAKSKAYHVAVHRTATMSGDATLRLLTGSTFTNGVQQLTTNGWIAGTDSTVNTQNSDYYWAAFKDRVAAAQADVQVTLGVDHPNPNRGDTLTYTLLVRNTGPDPATRVTVTDRLPAGLEFVSAAPNQGGYDLVSGLWTVGDVPVGALETMTLRARVGATLGGTTVTDTASVSGSDQSDPSIANNVALATVTVQSADLAVTLAADHVFPDVGDTVTLTVTLANAGPDAATGVTLTDRLPPSLVYTSSSASQGSFAPTSGAWTVGALASGASATLQLRAAVAPDAAGATFADTASVTASVQGDPVAANNLATVTLSVTSADLRVSVAAENPAPTVGDTAVCTVTLVNAGPNAASGVALTDRLPPGTTFAGATASAGSYDSGTGVWTVGPLVAGGSATLVLHGRIDASAAGATLADTVAVTAADQADPSPGDERAIATWHVASADLGVAVAVNNPTPPENGTIAWLITLTNHGPDAATGITVRDLLPAGTNLTLATVSAGVYAPSTGDWTLGSLGASTDATLELVATVASGTAGSTITNRAALTGSYPFDPSTANDRDSVDIQPRPGGSSGLADIALAQTAGPLSPNPGDIINYSVTVTNNGPDTASGIQVREDLPTGATYAQHAATQGTLVPATGLWTVGTLAPAARASLTVAAVVDTGTAGLTLLANASLTALVQSDTVAANNSAAAGVTVAGADLAVYLDVDRATPNVGDTLTFTVIVKNEGPDPAAAVTVTDRLVPALAFARADADAGSYAPVSGLWTVGAVAPGEAAVLHLRAVVGPGNAGATLGDTASVRSAVTGDPTPGNDVATVTMIVQSADLAVSLAADRTHANQGDPVTYTITLSNNGPDAATGTVVTDQLPVGLNYQSDVASQGAYARATGAWSAGDLASGAIATLTLRAVFDAGLAGVTVVNRASLSAADQDDPDSANDRDSIGVVITNADLKLAVVAVPTDPDIGDTLRFHVRVDNAGPDEATGVAIVNAFPPQLVLVDAAASQGAFVPGTGVWTVGAIARDDSVTLDMRAVLDSSALGVAFVDSARVAATDQGDASPLDNRAVATARVTRVDLAVSVAPDRARPDVGDTLTWIVTLANHGPDDAHAITVADRLPAGLDGVDALASDGSYDATTGAWSVNSLANGASATLRLLAIVDSTSTGAVLADTAAIALVHETDTNAANDRAIATVTVTSADLAVRVAASPAAPVVGDTLTYTVNVANAGPDTATHVVIVDRVPASLAFVSATATSGSYAAATGLWSVGTLAPGDSASLSVRARATVAAAGTTLSDTALVASVDQADPAPTNDVATSSVYVTEPLALHVRVAAQPATLRPGAPPIEVLRLTLVNASIKATARLDSLTLTNATQGSGTAAQLDAEWQPLQLVVPGPAPAPTAVTLSGGRAPWSGLGLAIAPGDSMTLSIWSGSSVAARDGDVLALSLARATDLGFTSVATFDNPWPLVAAGGFTVDGMTAAQIAVDNIDAVFESGSHRNLAFSARLPANGYAADVLEKVNVLNLGSARAGIDLGRLELWTDANGDRGFDAAVDANVGTLEFTGDRWEITGLAVPIPATGLRVFVTLDVLETAAEGRTVRLALPGAPDFALGVGSNDDGPLDGPVAATSVQTISTADRVTLAAAPIASSVVAPGARGVPLLELHAVNGYSVSRSLASLVVTNLTEGSGSVAQRDDEIAKLDLRLDANGNGRLDDLATDPLLGTTTLLDGSATFAGLDLPLAARAAATLIVTADVSSAAAADGDVLGVNLADAGAVGFHEVTSVAAGWPLDSGARATIDGMVAAQVVNLGAPPMTLGHDDGPVAAFDVIVPRDGYRDDTLQQVQLVNAGNATATDVAEVRLWRDGGNGTFDAGAGDDRDLGAMTYSGGRWASATLGEAVAAAGAHLFATVRAGATVTDSATVQLRIPRLGITMGSGDDGPVDTTVTNAAELKLSTSALLAWIGLTPSASTVGQTVAARLHVRNVGSTTITNVGPDTAEPLMLGDGAVSVQATPAPDQVDLAAGDEHVFEWTLRAEAPGEVRVRASASGAEDGTELSVRSVLTSSNPHRISLQAQTLGVFATGSMPFSINRGQPHIVPLSLTFSNPGSTAASDIRIRRLVLRLEDGAGAPIVPSGLVSRVVVNEGTTIYLEKTAIETSGATVDLTLAQPVFIQAGGGSGRQVTLSLSLDVSPTTVVPNFRVAVENQASFAAEDANSGATVTIQLDPGQAYPLRSGVARIVSEATALGVDSVAAAPLFADRGQSGLPLLDVDLSNPGIAGLGSDVRLSMLGLRLVDASGAGVGRPGRVLSHLTVRAGTQTLADRHVDSAEDSTLVIAFVSLLSVPVGAPVRLSVSATVGDSADLGTYRLCLADSATLDPHDANTGVAVPASYSAPRIQGPPFAVQMRADSVRVARLAQMPAAVPVGSRDVPSLTVILRHPGTSATASVDCRALTVRCRGQSGQPLVPSDFVSRVRVLLQGTEVGLETNVPATGNAVVVPLAGVVVTPGASVGLEVRFDVLVTAPAVLFELSVAADGVAAFDHNLGTPAAVAPDSGAELPLSSGLAQLQPPARQLVASFAGSMPAVLVADGSAIPVATLTLTNTAGATSGSIPLDYLDFVASDRDSRAVPIGAAVSRVQAWIGDTLWSDVPLADTATVARLQGAAVLALAPGRATPVTLRATLRTGSGAGSLRVGIDASGIAVIQPASALLTIAVLAAPGERLPFWTQVGNFSNTSLAESWSNYPNPFPAGRGETRFVFYLPSAARVSLDIWTPRGERVASAASNTTLGAGLHQELSWDGRNSRGQSVFNGVYVAELNVRFDDGTSTRLLRNIVVVR